MSNLLRFATASMLTPANRRVQQLVRSVFSSSICVETLRPIDERTARRLDKDAIWDPMSQRFGLSSVVSEFVAGTGESSLVRRFIEGAVCYYEDESVFARASGTSVPPTIHPAIPAPAKSPQPVPQGVVNAQNGGGQQTQAPQSPNQIEFSRYDQGKVVIGGWPGVRGEVHVGVPVRDRFGEQIVVYRERAGGKLHSRTLSRWEIGRIEDIPLP